MVKMNAGFKAAVARWDKMEQTYRARIERQRRGLTRMVELNQRLVAGLLEIKDGHVKNPAGRADQILTDCEELLQHLKDVEAAEEESDTEQRQSP
jgi:hypothetical protein